MPSQDSTARFAVQIRNVRLIYRNDVQLETSQCDLSISGVRISEVDGSERTISRNGAVILLFFFILIFKQVYNLQ